MPQLPLRHKSHGQRSVLTVTKSHMDVNENNIPQPAAPDYGFLCRTLAELSRKIDATYEFIQELKHRHETIMGQVWFDRKTLMRLLAVSQSTIYRWRRGEFGSELPYHVREDGTTYYVYDEVYSALRRGKLQAKGFDRILAIRNMEAYREGIVNGALPEIFDSENGSLTANIGL